jgi:hypothetical protein
MRPLRWLGEFADRFRQKAKLLAHGFVVAKTALKCEQREL